MTYGQHRGRIPRVPWVWLHSHAKTYCLFTTGILNFTRPAGGNAPAADRVRKGSTVAQIGFCAWLDEREMGASTIRRVVGDQLPHLGQILEVHVPSPWLHALNSLDSGERDVRILSLHDYTMPRGLCKTYIAAPLEVLASA
jgi:hypothetical protein